MRRHLRPLLSAVALLLVGTAAWWLFPPGNFADVPHLDPGRTADAKAEYRPAAPDATARTTLRPSAPPRVGKELLRESAPAADPAMVLPGTLPALDASIAPPLPETEPPVEELNVDGQLQLWAAREGARAAWPVVSGCVGSWQGKLRLEFGLAGGEVIGSSRYWDPKVAGVPAEISACILSGLTDLRAAAPTDASGVAAVVYRIGPAQP